MYLEDTKLAEGLRAAKIETDLIWDICGHIETRRTDRVAEYGPEFMPEAERLLRLFIAKMGRSVMTVLRSKTSFPAVMSMASSRL